MQKVSKTEAAAPSLPGFYLVVHVASVKAKGKLYAVVGIAAGAASGGPDLEGLLLHWACVSGQGQEWQQPPPGWHTDPDFSQGAGEGPICADNVVLRSLPLQCKSVQFMPPGSRAVINTISVSCFMQAYDVLGVVAYYRAVYACSQTAKTECW